MSSSNEPIMITIMHTGKIDVPSSVIRTEIEHIVSAVINVRKHTSTVHPVRQIVTSMFSVTKLEDGKFDLGVYVSGKLDSQIATPPGIHESLIHDALNELYFGALNKVSFDQNGPNITDRHPRTITGMHDDLVQARRQAVLHITQNREVAAQQHRIENELFARLDRELNLEHHHTPGGKVSMFEERRGPDSRD